jgi:hypothetical protein
MACMEAFTRFLLVTAIRIPKEIFVFGTLSSAVVIMPPGTKAPQEVFEKHIPGKAQAE